MRGIVRKTRSAFATLSRGCDRFINLMKWPVAIVSIYLLPRSAMAALAELRGIVSAPWEVLPLVIGLVGSLLIWHRHLRRRSAGGFFLTLEHEFTHALFAWLTFHRVTGFRATWRSGGSISLRGEGNWLIAIAPYFFPTVAVAVMAFAVFAPENWRPALATALGAALGYHVVSTSRETHRGQTDLQKVGWVFALMFLPTANLIAIGAVLAGAVGGWDQLATFLKALR